MKTYSSVIFERNEGNGDAVALIDQNGLRRTLWKDLILRSRRVAAYAVKRKLQGVIPVAMERCAEAVETLLGLNLAGIGTAPMPSKVPADRLLLIEKETGNTAWTAADYQAAMGEEPLDKGASLDISEPAIVIFTSGSTGIPKGVMLSNDAVLKAIIRISERFFHYEKTDIALQHASFSFVAIVLDLMSPLYSGVPVHLLPEASRKDAALITDYINAHGITASFAPPKVIRLLGEMPSMRIMIVGGERLSNFASDSYRLVNIYGLSETGGGAFYYPVTCAEENTPIGKPDPDFDCYLVDEKGNLADEGEICFSGAVAMGYYRHPELSEGIFTQNPFSRKPGHEVLLHSGDLARRLPDGNLLFLNRLDFMIKINGQRVEPGETEAAIKQVCPVRDTAVLGYTEEDGRSYLCAYYEADEPLNIDECRQALSAKLPSYMIPSYWVHLDKFPLNPNGKLDRKALVRPFDAAHFTEYTAPVGENEIQIAKAFESVLGLQHVGALDDFFCLGGDSMKAMEAAKLVSLASLGAGDILLGKTPRQIAKRMQEKQTPVLFSREPVPDFCPLTDSQMGIYLQCMMRPESVMYNMPMHISMERREGMTASYIKNAVDKVLALHPALYAFLKPEGESILMCRNLFPEQGICEVSEAAEALTKEQEAAFVRQFSLFQGPLCRARVVATPCQIHLYVDCHHIVCDGTSLSLLISQFRDSLLDLPLCQEQTDAFCVCGMEKKQADEETMAAAETYFEGLLAGNEIDSNLLFDKKIEEGATYASETAEITLTLPRLSSYLCREGLTESSFFMGVFGYVLAKMTGQTESLFAVAESGRKTPGTDGTVSMFVRTLPVLYRLDETKPASEMLRRGQEQFYDSVQNDAYSFAKIAGEFGVSSDVMFVYQSEMLADVPGVTVDQIPVGEAFANLALSVWKRGEGYRLLIEYRRDCYLCRTIARFASLFEKAAKAFSEGVLPKDIPLIGEEDLSALAALNQTESPFDGEKTLVDWFRRSAELYPEKTAVVCQDRKYTYREVDQISDRLSAYIHRLGIQKGESVSVLIPRCEYMLIASLGVLKAGAVYQPLDPSYPSERLTFMCRDADSKLLIAEGGLLDLLPGYEAPILRLDEIQNLPEGRYDGKPAAEDGFVLLYTSGTTGLPKGCKLLHRNISAYVHAFNTLFAMDRDCVSGAYASYGFDAHLSEIYPPISVGAELHIITEDIRLDLEALKDYFEKNQITHTVMTTQIARQFVTEYPKVEHLRSILCGGEKLATVTPPVSYRLTNGYGPTEATVMVTCFPVDKVYGDIPIGKALPNTKLYVVDPFGRQVPVGVPGELIAYGPQVAEGYLNRPEKTAEVFIDNLFDGQRESAYAHGYKTGDIVRFLDNGQLEIIGRRDQQVKIRGFRIELSEVENVLREYPAVCDATAIAVDDAAGGKCIHAYVVGKEPIDISLLHSFIKSKKPAYMVPAATMQIDKIPLTPNMKVDKRKLPPIAERESAGADNQTRQLTTLEEKLSELLEGIVGHRRFGVETSFTDAGITSISSIRLAVQIYKQFGLHIVSKDILDGGSILSVENAIVSMFLDKQEQEQPTFDPRESCYPLTMSQLGVYTDSLSHGMDTYLIPMLIQLEDGVSVNKLKDAIRCAVKAHPSMLCHIYADEQGTPGVHPVPDLSFDIEESAEGIHAAPTRFAFDKAPLFRFRILKDMGKTYLLIEIHHIIADGESLGILLRDIAAAYEGKALSKETYTSFALAKEEEAARAGKEFEIAEAYYDSVFRGVSADYLPVADRFDAPAYGAYSRGLGMDREKIRAFCASANISENVFFGGVFALTLARFTAHGDALFATVHNGRGDPRTENTVAMTVKTMPFYLETPGESGVDTFLQAVDDRLKKLKKYDIYSFADAARKFGVSADLLFVYQGDLMQNLPLGQPVAVPAAGNAKAALSLEVCGAETTFSLHAEYNAGRYSEAFVKGFADAFATCAAEILVKKTLGEISVCSPEALEEFRDFNDTDWPIQQQPAYRLIENSVDRHPDKKAVVAGKESLTYRELDTMANALAYQIAGLGIPRESTVVLLFDRTKEIYIGELGVLKSACAFLCLSPDYPKERIRFILEDCSAKAIITTHAVAQRVDLLDCGDLPILYADDIDRSVASPRLSLEVDPEALVYMIYTSGSTGKPKGVMVQQKGFVTIADANPKNNETTQYVNDTSISTAVSAFTFDASVMEGLVALANGSTVCIADEAQIHNPELFCRYCLENRVTSLFGTPSFLLNLSDCEDFKKVVAGLKSVLAGGEEFTSVLLGRLLSMNPHLCVINGYGPSEATVTCSSAQLKANERITIGTPLTNTKLYCMDAHNHILPMGALGELTIVGDVVGKGYLNREDLTKKAFITVAGKPAFKTGDLAVITHEGQIEFHGRMDNQLKIRGLRVELGEIECVMNAVDGMKNAVVVVKGSGENKYLAAYYTAGRSILKEEIIAVISQKLAAYMVPRHFMQLAEMPMTANGKIDKKALPEISLQREKTVDKKALSATETAVCDLFASLLCLNEYLPEDNFFEMGGNSLLASRAVMQLKSKGYTVEYQTIFDCQTPRALAAFLDKDAVGREETPTGEQKSEPAEMPFDEVLKYNTLSYADQTEREPLGDVVLTGAVGFLGIHVLWELLHSESGHIYCLVRRGSFPDPESRLNAISFYYFGVCLPEQFPGRITVLDADITSENLPGIFKDISFETAINCAASVKHYAADHSIEFVNVHGVENLISLVKGKNARLIQISTTSVPGVHTEETLKNHVVLHENQVFVANDMNNQYLISKYHAELCMLKAIREGMRGKIIRVGNLMGRFRDGEFQINMNSNAFLNALKGFTVMGKSPVGHSTDPMEFSPVDCTAQAIVALAGTNDMFTLFHANTRFVVDEMMLMKAATRCGLPIVPTPDKQYYEEYNRLLGDPKMNKYLSALLTNDRPDVHPISVDNTFTANILYRLGFSWPCIDDGYFDRVIGSLRDLGFFDWKI